MDDAEQLAAETVAGVLTGWGIPTRVVDAGLLFGPDGIRGLMLWFSTELERRNELMELAERVRTVLLDVVGGSLTSAHLDELEAVMMRYQLTAQDDKARLGLGSLLDLFGDPPTDT